jgi:hypothetical protein
MSTASINSSSPWLTLVASVAQRSSNSPEDDPSGFRTSSRRKPPLHLGPALLDTRGAGHLFSPDQREAAGETLDLFFEILEVERLVSPMTGHLASNGAFKTVREYKCLN